ncbi:MAG: tetratricopeptide repeat protein [Deltaproteobacteria bacterium]|nr:tetratricopeptide repeat protein [Deltaproteobacteria bacterium]
MTPCTPLLIALLAAAPAAQPTPPPAGHVAAAGALAAAREAREAGDVPGAQALLRKAVAADPGWDLPRLDLAELLLSEGGAADAARQLLSAPGLQSASPRLPRLRGAAAEQLGDAEGAAAAYGEALSLRDDLDLRLHRAVLLARSGAGPQAQAEAERVRSERPGDLLARSLLADLYEQAGLRAEAEAELRWLAGAAPTDPAPLRRLAAFLARGGDAAGAEAAESAARARNGRAARSLRPLLPDPRR